MDHVVVHSGAGGEEGPSQQEIEKRIRKVRVIGSVIVVVAAASLATAILVSAIPLTFVLIVALVGGLMAVWMSFRRNTDFGILGGILFGVFIGSWGFLSDLLSPSMSDDFLMTFWPGMSAWALGFGLAALPLARFSYMRKRKAIRSDLASIQRNRKSGDGAVVAPFRAGAEKMGKGSLVSGIVLGALMVGFGLYTWLFMDLLVGLVLAVMMAVPVVFLAWMLKLRGEDPVTSSRS